MANKEAPDKFVLPIFAFLMILVISGASSSDPLCATNSAIVRGKISSTSSTMTALFQRCAEKYSDLRRQQGMNVDVDLDIERTGIGQTANKSYLFRVPSLFTWAEQNELVFPILSRAVVMVFNVPGVKTLNMPVETVADIYKRNITLWNDPEIRRRNPNVSLPAEKILVLARQEEVDTSTALFTSMLTRLDSEWAEKYGHFGGPAFVNGTCCKSKNWKNAVDFFPVGTVGVVGLISSVPYTIGYGNRPEMEMYDLAKIILLNKTSGKILDPTVEALQIPMRDSVSRIDESVVVENGTIALGSNTTADGAYPMEATSYAIVNMVHASNDGVDCCQVQEMVGFLEFVISPPIPEDFTSEWFSPVPDTMASLITRLVLKRITCNDRNVYQAYQDSKVRPSKAAGSGSSVTEIIFILLTLSAVSVTAAVAVYVCKKIRKRRITEKSYLINDNRLKLEMMAALPKLLTDDATSARGSKIATNEGVENSNKHKEAIFLKNVYLHGALDENLQVDMAEFLLPTNGKLGHQGKVYAIATWSEKTRTLAVKLRKSSSGHRNLATFVGLTELTDLKTYTVFEHCAKGTLHYNLATCRYRLTDSIRRYLALDVASGLEYLHTRVGVVHGQLNSLTCLLDLAWTVKIALWDQTALHYSESVRRGRADGNLSFSTADCRWECGPEEVKSLVLNETGSEAVIRLLYLDPQLPLVYPQAAVDVFSFGVLVAEIFSGKIPYYHQLIGQRREESSENEPRTPEVLNKETNYYIRMLEEKFSKPTSVVLPSLPKSSPKYAQNIVEACLRPDAAKRPTMKTILRHLSVSATDANKGGLVDAMMETMDTYAEQLEEKVEERTAELRQVTGRMRDLLNEVLPPQIAEKLFQGVAVPPEYFECITVYFSDIVGFTIISARSSPIQVMNFLNDLWLMFDAIIQDFDVYKVDTIGDAYMVCSGLPNRNGVEHCRQIGRMSIALLEACKRFKIGHLPDEKLHIRIGLNSGPVTAGVVGLKMPQYCVFGDTVNTAARMESTSLPGRIQISTTTYMLLVDHFPGEFIYEYRGEINVKGKGNMLTYWLLSGEEAAKRSKNSALSTQF